MWADRLRPGELHDEAEVPVIRPSRGTHITLAHEALPLHGGAIVPAGSGRSIFALPWLGSTLIGTTDNDYDGDGPRSHPAVRRRHRRICSTRRTRFFGTSLTAADISGAFAGVRPLISTGDPKKSVDISRKAELYETSSGMITITGGKLTTWRRMAKMTVDRIVERDDRDAPCRTHEIPLGQAVDGCRSAARGGRARRARTSASPAATAMTPATCSPSPPSAVSWHSRSSEGPADLLAEAVHAARHEQARSVGDALLRRTRLGLLAARAVSDENVAQRVASAMAPELGWDENTAGEQARAFLDEAAAEGIAAGSRAGA